MRAMRERWAWLTPALLICAARVLLIPLRRSALYTRCLLLATYPLRPPADETT